MKLLAHEFNTLLAALLLSVSLAGAAKHEGADLVIVHARINTLDPQGSVAEALAITGDRIIYIGSDQRARPYIGKRTRIIDARRRTVLPGFIDSHTHPISGGMLLSQCNLHELKSAAEMVRAIEEYSTSNPQKEWVTGAGWDLHICPATGPTKGLLDAVVPKRPVIMEAIDGHSIWVNSRAMEMAGINKTTPDPPGGRIERDRATGEPLGTLRESAMSLVRRHVPKPGKEDRANGLRMAMRLANKLGITAMLEANASPELLETYATAESSGTLTVRITASQHYDPQKTISQVSDFVTANQRWNSLWSRCGQVKLFIDGVIESRTAALLQPYVGTDQIGETIYTPAQLNDILTALDSAGLQAHFHAIGDRAVRIALDAVEAARKANGPRDVRHHIAHLELVSPDEFSRFSSLGVTANVQALWAYPDQDILKLTFPVLGPQRSRSLYPIGSIARTGARIAGGSDWSVTSMNPLEAIQVAVARRALDGVGEPLNASEAVDLVTMVKAYTINGAWLRGQDKSIGSLEVGKLADLIVLNGDLFHTPLTLIHRLRVIRTFVGGREVYTDTALPR